MKTSRATFSAGCVVVIWVVPFGSPTAIVTSVGNTFQQDGTGIAYGFAVEEEIQDYFETAGSGAVLVYDDRYFDRTKVRVRDFDLQKLSADLGVTDASFEILNSVAGTATLLTDDRTVRFTADSSGLSSFTFAVVDNNATAAIRTVQLDVTNVPPEVDLGPDRTGHEGDTFSFDGTYSDPGDDTVHVFAWKVTNDSDQVVAEGTNQAFTFAPADDGTYTVNYSVTDGLGETGADDVVLTVANVAPAVNATHATVTVDEGDTAANSGTFSDPGADTVTLTASVGTVTGNSNGTWNWSWDTSDGPDDSQKVTITATDSDDAATSVDFDLKVNNVAPIVSTANAAVTVNEGDKATNSGLFSDPGVDNVTLTASVGTVTDNGNGTWSWAWDTSDGPDESQVVTITAKDSDHAATSIDFDLTVRNVAPTVTDAVFDVVENSANGAVVGSVAAGDPGADTLTWSIVSGNELGAYAINSATGEITVADATQLDFETTPLFELEVTVTDDEEASGTAAVTINLLNQASLTGTVFVDTDQNDLFDANELGIDGVAVDLLDAYGEVLDTVFTSDGGFYLFDDLDPGTYSIRETQPTGVTDGAELLGTLGGQVTADDQMQVSLERIDAADYDFAELGQDLTSGDTAAIGFWQNKHGQALIASGGTALADWLTSNFGNIFGDEFVGASGNAVASFYRDQLFKQKATKPGGPAKVDAHFMAVALSTFFTSSHLTGTVAADYGFNVTHTGIGTNVVNVGGAGDAFGVEDDTELTIMQLLLATNDMTDQPDNVSGFARIYDRNGDGVIDAAEQRLRWLANDLFAWITGFNAG